MGKVKKALDERNDDLVISTITEDSEIRQEWKNTLSFTADINFTTPHAALLPLTQEIETMCTINCVSFYIVIKITWICDSGSSCLITIINIEHSM